MSLPAAHLLSLPRELRDQIYSYLPQDILFKWLCRSGRRSGRHTIEARIADAPSMALLLVCMQTHNESLTSPTFQNLNMILDTTSLTRFDEFKRNAVRTHRLFKHVRHVTLHVTYTHAHSYWFMDWIRWGSFLTSLHFATPNMKSIRIATYSGSQAMDPAQFDLSESILGGYSGGKPSMAPQCFAGFGLRQIAQCSRIEAPAEGEARVWRTTEEREMFSGWRWMCMYVFGTMGEKQMWWTTEEAMGIVPMVAENESGLDAPNFATSTLERLQILQWVDKRDDEISFVDPYHSSRPSDDKDELVFDDHHEWKINDSYYRNGERTRQVEVGGFAAWFDMEEGESDAWYDMEEGGFAAWFEPRRG